MWYNCIDSLSLPSLLFFIINKERSKLIPKTNHVHKGIISFRTSNSHSNSRQNKKVSFSSEENSSNSQSSKRFSSSSGHDSIMFGINSICTPFHDHSQLHLLCFWKPSSLDLEIHIPATQHLKSHLQWWLNAVNAMRDRSLHQKQANTTINDRCFKKGYGDSNRQAFHSGHIVRVSTETTYKLPGVGRSSSYHNTFSSSLGNSQRFSQMRQHNCCSVHKERRTKSPSLCLRTWDL